MFCYDMRCNESALWPGHSKDKKKAVQWPVPFGCCGRTLHESTWAVESSFDVQSTSFRQPSATASPHGQTALRALSRRKSMASPQLSASHRLSRSGRVELLAEIEPSAFEHKTNNMNFR